MRTTDSADQTSSVQYSTVMVAPPLSQEWGWYLYGLTSQDTRTSALAEQLPLLDGEPVGILEQEGLVALVRRVPLAEFSGAALRAHLQNVAWLEMMARSHNKIVELVHAQQAILPSKFGCVYADVRKLQTALAHSHDAFLSQLEQVAGCDEWSVRLSLDSTALERLASDQDPELRDVREQVATATSGRAYLLRRKLADAVVAARERTASALAQAVYEQLLRHARLGQINDSVAASEKTVRVDGADSVILRASLLVPRTNAAALLVTADQCAKDVSGLTCVCEGPWPPYSFATPTMGGVV